jgi:hypothetical protein
MNFGNRMQNAEPLVNQKAKRSRSVSVEIENVQFFCYFWKLEEKSRKKTMPPVRIEPTPVWVHY